MAADHDALAAVISPRTVALLMMSPSMPSGCVLVATLGGVARLCNEHDLFLLYDAAMEALVFDGRELCGPLEHEGMADGP